MSAALVLVVNAGSSSLKYSLVETVTGAHLGVGLVERIGASGGAIRHDVGGERFSDDVDVPDHEAAFALALRAFETHGPHFRPDELVAVGHRVVHGGSRFTAPTLVDDDLVAAVGSLVPLAPLHNPGNLEGIAVARRIFRGVPQVAVFDTAFHHTLPPEAYTYAIPARWRDELGIRRYGFHGTSHAYVSRRTADLVGRPLEEVDTVVLHLGNGCSASAVEGGRSIETSMGMSPLEGLVMGTRSGDIDPAIPGHLARVEGLDAAAVDTELNRRSGLLGLAGVSDFREITERLEAGDSAASLAFDVVVHRLVKYVGAYAAVLGRLDALTFTGGIGENAPVLRAAVARRLGVLGVVLDDDANASGGGERIVSSPDSRVAVCVVPTDEELEIARQAAGVAAR